jgi:hypothetical protein
MMTLGDGPGVACGLKLRHDHGSNYMSGDFQDEIKCLGIEASPSFVREPQDKMSSICPRVRQVPPSPLNQ